MEIGIHCKYNCIKKNWVLLIKNAVKMDNNKDYNDNNKDIYIFSFNSKKKYNGKICS